MKYFVLNKFIDKTQDLSTFYSFKEFPARIPIHGMLEKHVQEDIRIDKDIRVRGLMG